MEFHEFSSTWVNFVVFSIVVANHQAEHPTSGRSSLRRERADFIRKRPWPRRVSSHRTRETGVCCVIELFENMGISVIET